MKKDEVTEERIIRAMVGRALEIRYPYHTPNIGEEIFRVQNWNVFHPLQPERQIVRDAHFHLRRGEIVGLAGLMGAGRTELAMSTFGQSYGRAISGKGYENGKESQTRNVTEVIKKGIAYASEDR